MKLFTENIPRTPWSRIDPPHEEHPSKEEVPFINSEPDLKRVKSLSGEIKEEVDIKKLVVVGHGGSITTFMGIYSSLLLYRGHPEVYFVNTVDEEYLRYVRRRTRENALLLVISKSGRTQTTLEAMEWFTHLPGAVITQRGSSPLRRIAEERGWWVLDHPPDVDGRFSGGFETALLPSSLCGLNVDEYLSAVRTAYSEWFSPRGDLYEIAWRYYLWEKAGREILYVPIYSKGLSGFSSLITQLIHESTGKEGRGMTTLVMEGPECQHHTNQRILGGRENVSALFVLPLKDSPLRWEAEGSIEAFKEAGIPHLRIEYQEVNEASVGRFVAFWHIFTLYSAILRGLQPFGQPEVEKAKEHSRRIRREKGVKNWD
ncbi:MAG: hypothetical protein J7L88_02985 [Thermoplasmata archaeon]|nr:hypothetical protein [Thermoplasmata archaeon]